mgnify:CR=1 FL=1
MKSKQQIIKNSEGQELLYPTQPDLHIRNILSREECMEMRRLTEIFPNSEGTGVVQLRRADRGLYEVDRQYWSFKEVPIFLDKIRKKLEYYYDTTIHKPSHWHIMKYRKPGDGLAWHAEGRISYVSFSINLSHEDEHKGGDFQLHEDRSLKLNMGDGVAYSGHSVHQVAPLVSGVKYSIVAWFQDDSRINVMKEPFPYKDEKFKK